MIRLAILLAACLFAAPLLAQDTPYAFFSTNAKEPATGKHGDKAGDLLLRPNNEVPYYIYLHNPGSEARENITVVLAADDKGDRILAEGVVAKIDKTSTARVTLVAKAPLIPPPEKSTAAPTSSLPPKVYLFIVRPTETNPRVRLGEVSNHTVSIMSPKDYLSIDTRTPSGIAAGQGDLYVTLGDKGQVATPAVKLIREKAVPVALNVRPDLLESLDTTFPYDVGTFQAEVGPGATNITLLAKNLRFVRNGGVNYLSVDADGVSNAFVYKLDISGTSPTPVEEKGGFLRVNLPRYAIPGKPIVARFEIFGDNPTGTPRWKFVRIDDRKIETTISGNPLTAPRHLKTGFRIGSEGEFLANSDVKDWAIEINTGGLTGLCKLSFELENSNPKFKAAETLITFDSTAPVGVEFVNPPSKLEKGKKLTVTAKASDPESGISSVWFYLGELVDGKKAAPGTTAKGVLNADGTWSATFELIDPKAKVDVGVRVTNNVGLNNDATIAVAITEPVGADGKKPDTGTIEGKVIQGDERAQPNLEVVLKDAEGKPVTTTKTNEKGEFKFEKVKPGSYAVFSAKPIDYAKGEVKVTVVAGETAKASISVKR